MYSSSRPATKDEIATAIGIDSEKFIYNELEGVVSTISPNANFYEGLAPNILRGTGWITINDGSPHKRVVQVIKTSGFVPEYDDVDKITLGQMDDKILVDKVTIFPGGIRNEQEPLVGINTPKIYAGFEGATLRFNRIDGKDLVTTNLGTDGTKSSWNRKNKWIAIQEIIRNTLGVEIFSYLFPHDVITSPWTYIFMLVSNDFITSTRQDLSSDQTHHNKDYVVVFEPISNETSRWSRTLDEAKSSGKLYAGPWRDEPAEFPRLDFDMFLRATGNFITKPPLLSEEQANQFLRTGFYQVDELPSDARTWTGESVIIYMDGSYHRFMSSSYTWRYRLRNHDPNIFHRFFELIFDTYSTKDIRARFVHSDKISVQENMEIFSHGYIIIAGSSRKFDNYIKEMTLDFEVKVQFFYQQFVSSLPIKQQKENFDLYDHFFDYFNHLIDFIEAYIDDKIAFINPENHKYIYPMDYSEKDEYLNSHKDAILRRGKAIGRLYDISMLRDIPGKDIVLLDEVHPRAKYIANIAKLDKPEYQKHKIYSLLLKEKFNHVYQMAKQARLWKTPQQELIMDADLPLVVLE